MEHRKPRLMGALLAAWVSCAAHHASLGTVRSAHAARRLYDRLAPAYDITAWVFRPLGARRLQHRAVDLLNLYSGDIVVDLGCGTGVNLPVLAKAVGEHGQVVGVDLSSGMLAKARRRADRHRLGHVTLHQADLRCFRLPPGTTAVLATASMEMVPEHDAVLRDLADQLSPTGGRLAVGGLRRPPGWPDWGVAIGRIATTLFGVNRAYEDIQPWLSVRRHMDEIAFDTAAAGALYLIVARTRSARNDDTQPGRSPG